MNAMSRVMAILVFAVAGLIGTAHEGRSAAGGHPGSAADLKAVLRDLWSGHNFWLRNIALDNTTNNRKALDYAEKSVATNARQIAKAFAPFYGEAASERLLALLVKHSGAIKAYSEATVAGNRRRQDAAKADYASNMDEIATFFSGVSRYLPKDTVRGLFTAHGTHQFELIKELQEEDYAHEAETWQEMEQHGHAIADTLTAALERQFPNKFSGHVQ